MLLWTVLADGGQLIGVLLILAGAVGYLTLYYRRVIKGEGGGCGCGCGGAPQPSQDEKSRETTANREQFIPLENLGDLAVRHREEREEAKRAGDNESSPT